MTLDDIDRILTRLESTDVDECEIEHDGEIVRVKFHRPAARGAHAAHATATAISAQPDTVAIKAPAAGFFQQLHPLDMGKECSPCAVRSGQHVGYVEVDSVFCAVVAPQDGTRISVLVDDGQLIGYGEKVMELSIDASEARGDGNN